MDDAVKIEPVAESNKDNKDDSGGIVPSGLALVLALQAGQASAKVENIPD